MLHPHTRTPRTHIHGQRRCIIIISTTTHLPSLTHRKQQKNDIKSTKKPWKNNSCSTQSNCRITSGHKTMPKIASETTFAKHKRTHARAWNVHASATDERIAYVCVWACECVSVNGWCGIELGVTCDTLGPTVWMWMWMWKTLRVVNLCAALIPA